MISNICIIDFIRYDMFTLSVNVSNFISMPTYNLQNVKFAVKSFKSIVRYT